MVHDRSIVLTFYTMVAAIEVVVKIVVNKMENALSMHNRQCYLMASSGLQYRKIIVITTTPLYD